MQRILLGQTMWLTTSMKTPKEEAKHISNAWMPNCWYTLLIERILGAYKVSGSLATNTFTEGAIPQMPIILAPKQICQPNFLCIIRVENPSVSLFVFWPSWYNYYFLNVFYDRP